MNDKLILTRIRTSKDGTFGELRNARGEVLCVTCEDPWNDNQHNISCIPRGTYTVKKFYGRKYRDVWQVMNVPGRDAILIHNGNTIRDTEGCILVGAAFGMLEHLPSVTSSRDTLNRLRMILPDTFELTIDGVV